MTVEATPVVAAMKDTTKTGGMQRRGTAAAAMMVTSTKETLATRAVHRLDSELNVTV